MSTGLIFDIKELTVHDGPGVRVTVFFKGCPLRCVWCHNPEGLSGLPQPMKVNGHTKICGQMVEAAELAAKVKKNMEMLQYLKGGVTLSGGEPLMQPDFLLDCLRELAPLHRVLQTSGYGEEGVFRQAIEHCELVHFDLKQISPDLHRKFTGKDNALILRNLEQLKESGKPFVIRMAMIPGVNTDEIHFYAVAEQLLTVRDRVSIELLPYNPFSAAKYPWLDMKFGFAPDFVSEEMEQPYPVHIFERYGLSYQIF